MPSSVDGNSGTSFTSRTVTVTRSSPIWPPSSRARTVTSYVLSGRASKSGSLTKLRAPLSNAKWPASAPVSVVQVTSSPSGSVAVYLPTDLPLFSAFVTASRPITFGASSTSSTVMVTEILLSTTGGSSAMLLASFPSLTPTLMVRLGAVSRSSAAFVSNWPVAVLMPKRAAPLVME